MFLGFANFYRRFIKNFSRIAASPTSLLQKTGNNNLGVQASGHEEEQEVTAVAGSGGGVGGGESFKNLSTAAKSVKSKRPNFANANSGIDFLTPGAKEAFIHLEKAFTEALILR